MEHFQFFFATGTWWLITVVVIAAAAIAWLTYTRTTPQLSPGSRILLSGLRTIGIVFLALALFEPVLRQVRSEESRPGVVIAIDESASMALQDGQGARQTTRDAVVDLLRDRAEEDWVFVGFSDNVREADPADTFAVDGVRSDISRVLQWSTNVPVDERPGAILIITDGQINAGETPIGAAAALGIGVYSIGIGDTVVPTDAAVSGLLVPGVTVVNDPTPVSVVVSSTGYAGRAVELVLFEEDRVVDQDTTILPIDGVRTTAEFTWTPSAVGERKLSVRLSPLEGEATAANNITQDFVDVRKAKRVVYVVAGAPSPDVSFVIRALQKDPNVEVRTSIQKRGGEWYDRKPMPADVAEAELCVVIGFPIASSPADAVAAVAEAARRGTGLLFIPSRDVEYGRLGPLEDYLPFAVAASRPTEFRATPDVQRGTTADPILKVTGTDRDQELWNTLPPIYRTETFVTPRPGASVLATLKVNNVPLAEPLLLKREQDRRRSIAVMGYGLYRWELLGEGPQASRGAQPVEVFASFIGNAASWLAVKDDERRVEIRSSREFYGAGEHILFKATVLDESLAPIDDADVRVTLNDTTSREIVLAPLGGGRYRADAGPLPPGDYRYTGLAARQRQKVGDDQGRFSVGELSLEEAALTMNNDLLSGLALTTGARFGVADSAEQVIEALMNDPRLRPVASTRESDTTLWHTPWPLVIALGAFSLEWFTRKRRGLV